MRRLLKPGAVPTVFDWSSQKEPRRTLKRKLLASRDTDIERCVIFFIIYIYLYTYRSAGSSVG